MAALDWLPSRRRAALEQRLTRLESELTAARNENAGLEARLRMRGPVASGVEISWGQFEREKNDALRGSARHDTIEKMLSDPHVQQALRVSTLPLVNAEWSVKPASDDARDVEIAEFVSANLLRTTSDRYGRDFWAQTSWKAQRLPEILDMLASGFAMFHVSTRRVGAKLVYDRIQWLEPSSVDPKGWVLDDTDNLLRVKRTYGYPSGRYALEEALDVRDLALYVWDLRGARFEGRGLIRSLYGPWYRKDFVQRMGMIWAQKIGSPIPIVLYPDDYDAAEAGQANLLGQQARGTAPSNAYFVGRRGKDGQELVAKYMGEETQRVNRFGELVDMENAEMAAGGGTKSMLLGETTSGSRALGQTQASIEFLMVNAVAQTVCEWEMHGVGNMPGLIERLVDANFAGVQRYPELTVTRIDPGEKASQLESIVRAKQAGLVPEHLEVTKRVCALVGLDIPDDVFEEWQAEKDAQRELMQRQMTRGAGQPGESDDEPAETPADAALALPRLADPLAFVQRTCDLVVVSEAFRAGGQDVFKVLRGIHRSMIDEIVRRLREGKITPRNMDGQRRSRYRDGGVAREQLARAFNAVAVAGARHAEQEVARQGPPGQQAALELPGVPARWSAHVDQVGAVQAELDIGRIWQRLVGESLDEYMRLWTQGVRDDELVQRIEQFLEGLSEKPLEDAGRRAATTAYNQGRDAAARAMAAAGEALYALRTEVLDEATCEPCRALDGQLFRIGTPEYTENLPPAKCEGGERCRGFYVILAAPAAVSARPEDRWQGGEE